MTAKEDFLKRLRARPHPLGRALAPMEWSGAYMALLDQIVRWLRELPPDLVRVSRWEQHQLLHEELGTYASAPTLDIDLCGALVCVNPIARTYPGILGTVDLSRASYTQRLVLKADGSWEVEPSYDRAALVRIHPATLTAETFYGVLGDLLR